MHRIGAIFAISLGLGCGGGQPAPVPATEAGDDTSAPVADAPEASADAATTATESAPQGTPACRPSVTDDVPPTTEKPCPAAVCLESRPGLLATCIDTKHQGCRHFLLARVTPEGTTEPLNVYVRCPGDESIRPTLMKSYAATGVPTVAAPSEAPAKACTHIAVHDCPAE